MTKLKKYSLEDLERSYTGLTELEKAAYVGGGNEYYFDQNGKIVSVKANDLDYDQAFCGSKIDSMPNVKTIMIIYFLNIFY